ncbi:hypothetical protein EPO34_00750 [Patescibacteria group bacterium]|nr:MAG: hypothetical protein EPO34_00750 [Patescibacteria group bacterium]
MTVSPKRLALTFGLFAGLVHLVWSVLVAVGLAQGLVDFLYAAHFMSQMPSKVDPFSLGNAALLVIFSSAVGYAAGWVVATIWNKTANAK